jgi:urease accessory protein
MPSWIVLQLADSAFPTGGFAHSAGLEAMLQTGELAGVERFSRELIDQLAQGSLPIVAAAHDEPARLAELDAFTRATLWSHVATRASRAQGRALLDVAARSFRHDVLVDARARLSRPRVTDPVGGDSGPLTPALDGHLAPVFGFVTRALGVERDEALATFLHLGVRGALSAAVRLGCIGPSEGQAIHHRLHAPLDAALAHARTLKLEDVAQTAPLVELVQATQDRLYSRLFQS